MGRATLSSCLNSDFVVMGSLVVWLDTVKPGPQDVWGMLHEPHRRGNKTGSISGERCPVGETAQQEAMDH